MRINRFIGKFDLSQDTVRITDAGIVHQITRVLRLKKGDEIELCDGNGYEALAILQALDRSFVEVALGEKRKNENEPARRVTLYLAVLKRENFELAAMKATEVGVAEIVPVLTTRTVKTRLNLERMRKIIKEAAEQSGRGTVPRIREPISFFEALKDAAQDDVNLFFHIEEEKKLRSAVKNSTIPIFCRILEYDNKENAMHKITDSARIGIFIGPEGGWSDEEISYAKEAGFTLASLGRLTVRAETAAIIAAYLMAQGRNTCG